MADGSLRFNFPLPQLSKLRPGEIVVDLFAGGGGASEGLKQALGIDPALAYNHDEQAIGMHAANHPPDYIIDRTANGTPLTTSAAVRMVGNSVSPAPIAALARANLDTALVAERMAA